VLSVAAPGRSKPPRVVSRARAAVYAGAGRSPTFSRGLAWTTDRCPTACARGSRSTCAAACSAMVSCAWRASRATLTDPPAARFEQPRAGLAWGRMPEVAARRADVDPADPLRSAADASDHAQRVRGRRKPLSTTRKRTASGIAIAAACDGAPAARDRHHRWWRAVPPRRFAAYLDGGGFAGRVRCGALGGFNRPRLSIAPGVFDTERPPPRIAR
jgi:hypothetical protein